MKTQTTKFSNPKSLARFIRVRLGLSQNQLAHACDLTANDVSRIERGLYTIRIGALLKLAAYLGVSVDDVVKDDYASAVPKLGQPRRDQNAQKRMRKLAEKRITTGAAGEALVARMERAKLSDTVFEKAVNENYADNVDAGYDIMSFRRDGTPVHIEVKTTTGSANEAFFMTAGELEFAKYCAANGLAYELHRVYGLDRKGRGKQVIYSAEELLDCDFQVATYLVKGGA